LIFETKSPDETQALGERLGRRLEGGDVLALEGDLGAGKTCFVQGLARGLGIEASRRIGSPTFTLVNEHPGRVTLYHVDLYRLRDGRELEEIGLREYLEAGGVAAVEWFDRFPDYKPGERIDVRFERLDETRRRVVIEATGRAAGRIAQL
jgi:tRNA threonylcarbamoyladenosine biosynthesis protein TsaE